MIRFGLNTDQAIFESTYTSPKPLQICFQMASFGHLSVRIWIKPCSSPETHPQNHCRFNSRWLHSGTLLARSGSSHFRTQIHLPKSHCRFVSRRLHLDAFLSRSGSGHFRVRRHIHKTIADLVPDGIIRTPCCPDLDQAIFEPRYTFPKPLQICFQMA